MNRGVVFDIQRFSLHDGPGIRTTVFMKGCPLRCRWCQNPEGRDRDVAVRAFGDLCARCGDCIAVCPAGALVPDALGVPAVDRDLCLRCGRCVDECAYNAVVMDGRTLAVDQLLLELADDAAFFQASGGGVTFSGGEPLAQAGFVGEAAGRLREKGVHTAVETALCVPWRDVRLALPAVDLFIVDLKSADPARHKELTGVDGTGVLDNFRRLAGELKGSGRLQVRFTLVPGFSEGREARLAAEFYASVDPGLRLELMNFNPLAAAKYRRLRDEEYEFYRQTAPFSEAEMLAFRKEAAASGLEVV